MIDQFYLVNMIKFNQIKDGSLVGVLGGNIYFLTTSLN